MKKIDRTGEVKENLNGLEMKIIEYKNNKDVRVLFVANGETRKPTYLKFKQGKVYPTWRNRKYNGVDTHKDVRDVVGSGIIEDEGSNLGIALAMALGSIGIFALLIALIKWLC